ncbi:type II toxin-antitoxin system RelE/ParE family toxin [Herbiconiux sp. 11R-BC]|uniref:type II toxin-antitoxin system RelE family toxin n=1 Tax=Herbiconiux sp. 11R-BC TaxID=3111637 RepID=UPI003C01E42D
MTERYRVEFSPAAARSVRKLDPVVRRRVLVVVGLLRDEPRPAAMKALVGRPGELRVRVGDFRIISEINEGRLLVLVLTVGHRRDVYRVK